MQTSTIVQTADQKISMKLGFVMANWPIMILFPFLIIAATSDVRFRRVPNWLNFSAAVTGIACHVFMGGLNGLIFSLEGMLLGVALLILFYIMGGMGAGDVKLLGAIGTFLGPAGIFAAFLIAGIAGGIYAALSLIRNGRTLKALSRYAMMLKLSLFCGRITYLPPDQSEVGSELHYAVPIALGAVLSIFVPMIFSGWNPT